MPTQPENLLPPSDPAERAILGAVLVDNKVLARLENLQLTLRALAIVLARSLVGGLLLRLLGGLLLLLLALLELQLAVGPGHEAPVRAPGLVVAAAHELQLVAPAREVDLPDRAPAALEQPGDDLIQLARALLGAQLEREQVLRLAQEDPLALGHFRREEGTHQCGLLVGVLHDGHSKQDARPLENDGQELPDDAVESEVRESAVVDLRAFAFAHADQEHFRQAALDLPLEVGVGLYPVEDDDMVRLGCVAVDEDRDALGRLSQQDRLHAG